MEDALKRLDKLTQEEARMAAAQNLKATHTVDKRVQGVADTVVVIDNRVTGVDDRVASVNDTVATIDDRVKLVDNRVMEVISGEYYIFSQPLKRYTILEPLRYATNGQRCRSCETFAISLPHQCLLWSLTRPSREPITGEHSQLAFPIGPVNEPQHCM